MVLEEENINKTPEQQIQDLDNLNKQLVFFSNQVGFNSYSASLWNEMNERIKNIEIDIERILEFLKPKPQVQPTPKYAPIPQPRPVQPVYQQPQQPIQPKYQQQIQEQEIPEIDVELPDIPEFK